MRSWRNTWLRIRAVVQRCIQGHNLLIFVLTFEVFFPLPGLPNFLAKEIDSGTCLNLMQFFHSGNLPWTCRTDSSFSKLFGLIESPVTGACGYA